MSLFGESRNVLSAEMIAARQLTKANREFDHMLVTAKSDYSQFWQNKGGITPTQVLVAMGTSAQMFLTIAWARVQLLKTVATLVGKPESVDETSLLPPIPIEFNEDGSFKVT